MVTFLGYNDWIDVKIGLQLNKIFVIQKIFKNLCQIWALMKVENVRVLFQPKKVEER